MRRRNAFAGGILAAILVATGLTMGPAQAAIPAPVAGNITVLGSGVRVVPSPGQFISAGSTQTVKLGGETFQGQPIPANATGVTLSVANNQSAGAGQLRVWTTDAGQPGNPTISWGNGEVQTSVVFVGLNDEGKINVSTTTNTRYLIAVVGFVTPVPGPTAPVVMPAVARKALTHVGGTIRTESTDFGSVSLPAGRWDVRVTGSFRGLNASNNTVPAGVQLTGTMVLVAKPGAADAFEFTDVLATVGGVVIPDASSTTLTQDPTATISTFITLTAPTTVVRVKGFASAGDSSTAGSGELFMGVDSAQFLKLS